MPRLSFTLTARAYGLWCKKARDLVRSLGYKSAAGYLRNRDVDFATAYQVIFGRAPRV